MLFVLCWIFFCGRHLKGVGPALQFFFAGERYLALTRRVPLARFRSPLALREARIVNPIDLPAFARAKYARSRLVAR